MRRSITDVLRRGFENALANWPLLLLKIASTIVIGAIVIAAVIATIVPLAISVGVRGIADLRDPENVAQLLLSILTDHWIALLMAVSVVSVVLLIVVALVSFLEAGVMQVVADGERRAPAAASERSAFRAFTMQRWLSGAAAHGWAVFWIYNLAWTVASAIILLPLIATLAAMLALGEQPAAIAAGCAGLAISLLLFMAIAIVTSVWSKKAIALAVIRGLGAMAALRLAWTEMAGDFLRHFVVAFVLAALSFGVSGALSLFSLLGGADPTGMLSIALIPLQVGMSLLSGAISAGIAVWASASFAALTMESRA